MKTAKPLKYNTGDVVAGTIPCGEFAIRILNINRVDNRNLTFDVECVACGVRTTMHRTTLDNWKKHGKNIHKGCSACLCDDGSHYPTSIDWIAMPASLNHTQVHRSQLIGEYEVISFNEHGAIVEHTCGAQRWLSYQDLVAKIPCLECA